MRRPRSRELTRLPLPLPSFDRHRTQHRAWQLVASLLAWVALLAGGPAPSVAALGAPSAPASDPLRLKRSQAFLGIHFDFHAGRDCTEIGRNTTPAMIENILEQVRPDYLQIDCKGHPGLSSYPTKVGNRAPGFVGDPLRLWRQITAAHGVSLYMHYSGVWDSEAVRAHPEWAAVRADGKPDSNATSVFGPYVDQLLIPQLRELAGDYGVDGMWVDGECWATIPDFGEVAVRAFRERTGVSTVPRQASDAYWVEWMDFQREAFRKYLRHYVDELGRSHPDFEIASNWAFSDHMPEPVTAKVAFLSGDFSPQNSLNSARFSARCLENQGKPWDLMSWSFSAPQGHPVRPLKSIPQLAQEAAIVLAQGGGYQAYFRQKRDGSIYDWQMRLMAEVAKFCRARQAVCHRSEAVPQVALLYSRAAHYRSSPRLFAPWGSAGVQALRGVLQALIEAQNSVEIVSEHHLTGRMSRWPLIVIPEWDYLESGFRDELAAYARAGGSLLLVGPAAAALFAQETGMPPSLPAAAAPAAASPQVAVPVDEREGETAVAARYLEHDGWLAGLHTLRQKITTASATRSLGRLHVQDDPSSPSETAATLMPLGEGKLGVLWFNFGERYLNGRTAVARDFLQAVVRELYPDPLVEVTGSHHVDVSLRRNHGRLVLNLVNTAGPHEQEKQYVFDDIPPVGPLTIHLRLAKAPQSITRQPSGEALPFRYHDGRASVRLPRLEVHEALVVEE
ncbi:MAG: hypothetical protein FJ387_05815 [Verrucomicrobia bacterium]|nr:hypothetical protein [Verrucomicrobiota bacterium]